MPRWLSLVLLIGAVVGLFGQEMVFAAVPVTQVDIESSEVASMSADCAEMMGIEQPQSAPDPGAPCDGMTFECIAKMGCAAPAAVTPAVDADAVRVLWRPELTVKLAAPMLGRSVRPELHPPAILG